MNKITTWLLLVSVLMALTACQGPDLLENPPEIRYGEDICIECGMIIDDPRFAAAYVTTNEEVRLFDDIGDMLAYDTKEQENVHAFWVHDFVSEEWMHAAEASFVLQQDVITPMSWGVIAFKSAAAAEDFRREHGGTIADFDLLLTAVAMGNLEPSLLHDHFHDQDNHHDVETEHDHDLHDQSDAQNASKSLAARASFHFESSAGPDDMICSHDQ